MISLGLTGGFGTGKSTVLSMFSSCGAHILSSDEIVHEQLSTNQNLKKKIVGLFSTGVLNKGKIDRPRLAHAAFCDQKALGKLNLLLHPLVKNEIVKFLKKIKKTDKDAVAVVEVPLLFEVGFEKLFDSTVVVDAAPAVQKKRMLKSGRFDKKDLEIRMRFQMPLAAKIKACDYVIDNSHDKEKTFKQVKQLVELLG
ncbi:MAG TPA: dephospho-CoA kinase, partial [Candidatus Omnitrophota bacterium]|nr:dephospho-CoA kinase [Candidatus Omnitrophota bacterium]